MGHTTFRYMPDPGVRPRAELGGDIPDIPLLDLGPHPHQITVQFSTADPAETVAYLRELIGQAQWLLDRLTSLELATHLEQIPSRADPSSGPRHALGRAS